MRQKYIDERWPLLMQFGCTAGPVSLPVVTDSDDSVDLIMQNDAQADLLVKHYAKLHEEFSALAQAFDQANPEAFAAFWYNR